MRKESVKKLWTNLLKKGLGIIHETETSDFFNNTENQKYVINNKVIPLQASKDIFSKTAIITQKRSGNVKTVFEYPLGPLPWALLNSMGTMKKTTKSLLMYKLEEWSECILSEEGKNALIIDGMAYVKQLKAIDTTYGSFAANLLTIILSIRKDAQRIDVVFDVYRLQSIKNLERNRRACWNPSFQQILPTSEFTQWSLFLSSNDNKNALIKHLEAPWIKHSKNWAKGCLRQPGR